MKKVVILAVVTLISVTPYTYAEGFFLGANVGYAKVSVDEGKDDEDMVYGVEGGMQFGQLQRLTLVYNAQDLRQIDIDVFNLDYDFLIPLGSRVSLMVGVHSGYTMWEANFGGSEFDADGLNYGTQLGAELWLTPRLTLGTKFRYSFTDAEDRDVALKDTGSATANVVYHF